MIRFSLTIEDVAKLIFCSVFFFYMFHFEFPKTGKYVDFFYFLKKTVFKV